MAALVDTHTSTIRLHSVPWTDYKNVPDWSSQGALDTYFTDNYTDLLNNMTIVRPDTFYDIQMDINTFMSKHINYMTFDNGNGREYAFLKNPRFISLNTTRVDVVVDVWTTYLHKHNYAGIVERAHVDRWVNATTPIYYFGDQENIGTPVVNKVVSVSQPCVWAAIYCSEWPDAFKPSFTTNPRSLGGSPNTLKVYLIPFRVKPESSGGVADSSLVCIVNLNGVQRVCGYLAESNLFKSENIYKIQVLPFVPFNYSVQDGTEAVININTGLEGEFIRLNDASDTSICAIAVSSISGSVYSNSFNKHPANSIPGTLPTPSTPASWRYETRLWSAPYFTCVLSNYEESCEIDPALIDGNLIHWDMILSLGANDYGYSLQVNNYSGDNRSLYKTLNGTAPSGLSWATDKFYNYMVQNSAQIGLKIAMNSVSSTLNMLNAIPSKQSFRAAPAQSTMGAVTDVAQSSMQMLSDPLNLLATASDTEKWPKNVNSGAGNAGLMLAGGRNRINCAYIQANEYVLETKGSEFIQNGYEINKLVTNFDYRSRYWFNYVKYASCVCTSNSWRVPEHKEILENIYKSGVRIWHYRNGFSQFGKYNLDNTEV